MTPACKHEAESELAELERLALKTLRDLLEDAKSSPSVRLRAALAVLNRAAQLARKALSPRARAIAAFLAARNPALPAPALAQRSG